MMFARQAQGRAGKRSVGEGASPLPHPRKRARTSTSTTVATPPRLLSAAERAELLLCGAESISSWGGSSADGGGGGEGAAPEPVVEAESDGGLDGIFDGSPPARPHTTPPAPVDVVVLSECSSLSSFDGSPATPARGAATAPLSRAPLRPPPAAAEPEPAPEPRAAYGQSQGAGAGSTTWLRQTSITDWATAALRSVARPRAQVQTSLAAFFGVPRATGAGAATTTAAATSSSNDVGGAAGGGWGRLTRQSSRPCPFYKWIPRTSITVDAFRYGSIPGCKAYFLSHFHADHYGGLTKDFCGRIFCSAITKRLVVMKLRVPEHLVTALPLNKRVHLVDGVHVHLMDANHCPGAAIALFETPHGQTHLHTGDFRATRAMAQAEPLCSTRVHTLFLDTTYCNEKYAFPPQEQVLRFMASRARLEATAKKRRRVLFVIGSYTIGKEKVFMEVAEALNTRVYVEAPKLKILETYEWPALRELLTTDSGSAQVHVTPMSKITFKALKLYLAKNPAFTHIVGVRPTGWTHKPVASLNLLDPKRDGRVSIYGIPYSEHSSFTELRDFVQAVRPTKILATVNNGKKESRDKMDAYFRTWLGSASHGV